MFNDLLLTPFFRSLDFLKHTSHLAAKSSRKAPEHSGAARLTATASFRKSIGVILGTQNSCQSLVALGTHYDRP
jgi:hypothetical protein